MKLSDKLYTAVTCFGVIGLAFLFSFSFKCAVAVILLYIAYAIGEMADKQAENESKDSEKGKL